MSAINRAMVEIKVMGCPMVRVVVRADTLGAALVAARDWARTAPELTPMEYSFGARLVWAYQQALAAGATGDRLMLSRWENDNSQESVTVYPNVYVDDHVSTEAASPR